MKTNYVLIDYENVQPEDIDLLDQEWCKVKLFVGTNQTKVSFEVASALQSMGDRVEYIKISGNGKNALDFHIAFYIGQIAAKEPEAHYHILSRDSGFDPLIQHLRSRKILASRTGDIAEIPVIKAANSKSQAEHLDMIVGNLQRRGASAPKTFKTLSGTINSLFQNQLPEQEIAGLLGELQKQGWITINEAKVSYSLPG